MKEGLNFIQENKTMTMKSTVLLIAAAITITLFSSSFCSAGAYGDASEPGYVISVTPRDNGNLVVVLDHGVIPDQGCTYSDRAVLEPSLPGAKLQTVTLLMAMAADWLTVLYVDGCVEHIDSENYDSYVTVPRLTVSRSVK